jgi:hypothetical protein
MQDYCPWGVFLFSGEYKGSFILYQAFSTGKFIAMNQTIMLINDEMLEFDQETYDSARRKNSQKHTSHAIAGHSHFQTFKIFCETLLKMLKVLLALFPKAFKVFPKKKNILLEKTDIVFSGKAVSEKISIMLRQDLSLLLRHLSLGQVLNKLVGVKCKITAHGGFSSSLENIKTHSFCIKPLVPASLLR